MYKWVLSKSIAPSSNAPDLLSYVSTLHKADSMQTAQDRFALADARRFCWNVHCCITELRVNAVAKAAFFTKQSHSNADWTVRTKQENLFCRAGTKYNTASTYLFAVYGWT